MKYFISIALIWLSILSLLGQENYNPIKLGVGINTKYGEGHPMLSADGREIYFWRALYRQDANEEVQSLWYSVLNESGNWGAAKYLPAPFNIGNRSSAVFYVSPDNNTLLIRGYFKNNERLDKEGYSFVHRGENGFKNPIGIDFESYSDMVKGNYSGGCLLPDGKGLILYFSETAGSTNCDLYYSYKKDDGVFTKPAFIKSLNTDADESTPFVAADNKTLYFSSSRGGTLGSNDIWKTTRTDDTWLNWSEPVNMGSSINSANWEAYFCLDAKADYGYMTIDGDLVKIKLNDFQKPKPVTLIKGKVYDKNTLKPMQATINYENLETGKNEGIAISDPITGNYQIALPYGINYGFAAHSQNYIPISDNINLQELLEYKELNRDLFLVPEAVGEVIRINNIFFEFGKSDLLKESFVELNRITNYLKVNPNIKIEIMGHTDNIGNDSSNQLLSVNRALAVKDYFIAKGINQNRLMHSGFGNSNPIEKNDTEEGRAKNRRVEFKLISL